MNTFRRHMIHRMNWRWPGLVVVALACVMLAHSSLAEFEIPFISASSGNSAVEFHGVWGVDRGLYLDATTSYQQYESYAVGTDPNVTSCASGQPTDCNGVMYFYNGSGWQRVPNAAFESTYNSGVPFSLNAIVGQMNDGGGNPNPLWMVGSNNRIAWIPVSYYSTPGGSYVDGATTYKSTFVADNIRGQCKLTPDPDPKNTNKKFCATDADCTTSGDHCYIVHSNQTSSDYYQGTSDIRDYYAIDAGQNFNGVVLAGGQNGLVAKTDGRGNGNGYWKQFVPTIVDVNGNILPDTTHAALGISGENVTSIQFSNLTTAYILTSTFVADPNDSNQPKAPYNHDCSGNQTTYLYQTNGDLLTWKLLAKQSNTCGYALAVAPRFDDPSADCSSGICPLRNVIWLATSRGVYKFDEASRPPLGSLGSATNVTTPVYAISAVPDRGGSGTNLLANGNFYNMAKVNRADGWLYFDNAPGPAGAAAGTCGTNASYNVTTNGVIINNTSPSYPGSATCAAGNLDRYYTQAIVQSIPLSTIEGQKFRLTAHVKVEFPTLTTGYPTAPAAEGGIMTGCLGIANNASAGTIGEQVNCSYANRSAIFVNSGAGTIDKDIDMTFSREDSIFKDITRLGNTTIANNRMDLVIGCEATYGAKVTCTNLKLEEVDSPTIQARDTVSVITAGPDIGTNNILVNDDGAHSTTFVRETIPATASNPGINFTINSISAVGLQHIYAAGVSSNAGVTSGALLLNRTPSTLKGEIWIGAASTTGATSSTATGSISVSCVDDKGLSNNLKTLCQRSPQSYGLSLETTKTLAGTLTGRLIGQAWAGRPVGAANDNESLDLGSCSRNVTAFSDPSSKYKIAGSCDTSTRRCWNDPSHTTRSTTACLSDFDCYGRCSRDQGFLCISDSDCKVNISSANATNISQSTANFNVPPGQFLSCNSSSSATSPLACSGIGWFTVNYKDGPSWTPPLCDMSSHTCWSNPAVTCSSTYDASCPAQNIGVNYNTLFTAHNGGYQQANQGAHELSGWGRFMSLATPTSVDPYSPQSGWVHFRGSSVAAAPMTLSNIQGLPASYTTTPKGLFACRDCAGSVPTGNMNCSFCQDAANHSCVTSNNDATAGCFYVCEGTGTSAANPWIRCTNSTECSGHGTGICTAPGFCANTGALCTSDAQCGGVVGACQNFGAICSSAGSQCSTYGVHLDTESNKFYGSAWSQDYGWLNMNGVSYSGNRVIQTKLGDIYATGAIGASNLAEPNIGNCNATYVITSASTITGFCSETNQTQQNANPIPLISGGNTYSNILGRFDIQGIQTAVSGAKNKYGSTIVKNSATSGDISAWWKSNMIAVTGGYALGGKVYEIGDSNSCNGSVSPCPNTYSLGSEMDFGNGDITTATGSGAGILIVNGNLQINKDLKYIASNPGDLRNLASLIIVVTGNLTVDYDVANMVGAYYVYNNLLTAPTPNGIKAQSTNLTVSGLMIAKQFTFNRQKTGPIEQPVPSELVIYDGRIQSNPLPGAVDFSSALPNTAQVSP